jgi:hypothetical protein
LFLQLRHISLRAIVLFVVRSECWIENRRTISRIEVQTENGRAIFKGVKR